MNWEIILGISAVITAICALGLTIWQGRMAREHNMVSFRPHLTTWFDELYADGVFELFVVNNGVGPALIGSFIVLLDGRVVDGERTEPLKSAVQSLFSGYEFSSTQGFIGMSYSMRPNESRSLAKVVFKDKWPKREEMNKLIHHLNIVIKYRSLYDEVFLMDLHDEI